jgi:hypothetical protein
MFADLSESELRTRFVTPYRRGKDFLCGSEVVEVSLKKTVSIIRTTNRSDEELKRIQEKSRKEIEEAQSQFEVAGVSGPHQPQRDHPALPGEGRQEVGPNALGLIPHRWSYACVTVKGSL